MHSYIKLSTLNDFIFCPKSIYYHKLYDNYNPNLYHEKAQKEWKIAHESIDNKRYSSKKNIIQSLDVYSEFYWILWKIDIFDITKWNLIERKNKIKLDKNSNPIIYLWYKYQLWWQMYCLEELGYHVSNLWIHSLKDNKKYKIYKPSTKEFFNFYQLLKEYNNFNLFQKNWKQNIKKCRKCIYRELCDSYTW